MPRLRAPCSSCGGSHFVFVVPGEQISLDCPQTGQSFTVIGPKVPSAHAKQRPSTKTRKPAPKKTAAAKKAASKKAPADRKSSSRSSTQSKRSAARPSKYANLTPSQRKQQLRTVERRLAAVDEKLASLDTGRRALSADEYTHGKLKTQRDKAADSLARRLEAYALTQVPSLLAKIDRLKDRKVVVDRYSQYSREVNHGFWRGTETVTDTRIQRDLRVSVRDLDPTDRATPEMREKISGIRGEIAALESRISKIRKFRSADPAKVPPDPALSQSLINQVLKVQALDKQLAATRRPQADAWKQTQVREKQLESEKADLMKERAALLGSALGASSNPPPARVITQWQDAEELARDYMRWLGHHDVVCTGSGADGGVDLEGSKVVGQVKMHNRPTGRPDVQQLFGIASAEGKNAFFFAMAFSAEAVQWADKVNMAIYRFKRDGSVEPASTRARTR